MQVSGSEYTIDLSSVTGIDGNYELKLNASGSDIEDSAGGDMMIDAMDQFMVDLVGPTVESVVVNDGSAQRSVVTSITVTFSEDVGVVDASHFELTNTTTNTQVVPGVAYEVINGRTVATLTFSGSDFIGGSLADGRYTLTTLSTITDAAGNQLDGDRDGSGGDNATDEFFRFFGDFDGDGDVDRRDFSAFRQTFNLNSSSSSYNAAFDFDGDGDVDRRDFSAFRVNFGRRL